MIDDDVLDMILSFDGGSETRECDLFNFLLVSKQWYRRVAQAIQREVHRSESSLYESPFDVNEDILLDMLSEMRSHEWLIEPLMTFFRPRLLQPYRAALATKRIISLHWTSHAYLADAMINSLGLILRFLEMTPDRRYHAQYIDLDSPADAVDRLRHAVKRVEDDADNPFIVIRVALPCSWDDHAACEELIALMEHGFVATHFIDGGERERFVLPKGTVLIIVWYSYLAGYVEYPLRNLMATQLVIESHMTNNHHLREPLIRRINSNIILFANK